MSSYGFVYIMVNPSMTCFKVGCTERSPHARADELSRPTGVPEPFVVACYTEVYDFQGVERRIHGWLSQYRVSESREFFSDDALGYAVRILRWLPERLSFAVVAKHMVDDYDLEDEELNPFVGKPAAANDEQKGEGAEGAAVSGAEEAAA